MNPIQETTEKLMKIIEDNEAWGTVTHYYQIFHIIEEVYNNFEKEKKEIKQNKNVS